MERKFTRGLNKLGSAVQMRENVSQLVRESAVLNKPLVVEPIDFEAFIAKNKTVIQNDPQRELLIYPTDDVSEIIMPRKQRTNAKSVADRFDPPNEAIVCPLHGPAMITNGNGHSQVSRQGSIQSNGSHHNGNGNGHTSSSSSSSLNNSNGHGQLSRKSSQCSNGSSSHKDSSYESALSSITLRSNLAQPEEVDEFADDGHGEDLVDGQPHGSRAECTRFTRQALYTYRAKNHLIHYKYNAYGGNCHDLPSISPAEELVEEVYEIDADQDRIDEQMTRSQADTITKQGYLLKGPDSASDRMFANIGNKSFKRRYCYLRQEIDGTYILELHKDEKQGEAKATIVMDFCTDVVQNPKRGRFCFELRMTTGHKSFTLAAENEQDFKDWLSKISSVLAQNRAQEEKRNASLERQPSIGSNPSPQLQPPAMDPPTFGTLKGLDQSLHPQLMKYGRETDHSIALARREQRRRLFACYQSPVKGSGSDNVEQYREHFGSRLLLTCHNLRFRLQCIPQDEGSAGGVEQQVEPYITSLALFDAKANRKLSENFYFNVNEQWAAQLLPNMPVPSSVAGCGVPRKSAEGDERSSACQAPHSLFDGVSAELLRSNRQQFQQLRQCLLSVTAPHADIYLVVRIEKILQSGIAQVAEPYLKAGKDPKLGQKVYKAAKSYAQHIGHYRQPFAWAARPLFKQYSHELDVDPKREFEFSPIYRQEIPKLKDEEILKLLIDYRKPEKLSKLTVIPGSLKMQMQFLDQTTPCGLSKSLAPLSTFSPSSKQPPTVEVAEFQSHSERDAHPYTSFCNHLYVYPLSLQFDSQKLFSRARNITVVVELRDGDGEYSKPLKCIYGRPGQDLLVSQIACPVLHHNVTPTWYEEIKLRLPLGLFPEHHLLFSFYHVSCNLSKKRDAHAAFETPIGYAWLPLLQKNRICLEEQQLPVAATLPVGYLSIQPLGWGKGQNCGPDIQWIDNQRNLYTVGLRLDSTVLTADQHLHNFFGHCERLLEGGKTGAVPAETETCKILKAAHAIDMKSLINYLPTVLNELFTLLVHTQSEEIGLNVIRLITNIIHLISDQAKRSDLLGAYVKYVFHAPYYSQQTARQRTVHGELCRHLPYLLNPSNPDFLIVNKFMRYSSIFFDLIIKSMAQHLLATGRIRMLRNERFPKEYGDRVEQLIKALMPYITTRFEDLSEETHLLNRSLAKFVRQCLSYMDRGFVFRLIRCYMAEFAPGNPRILHEYKFNFLQEICQHEHYVPLNLPFVLNPKNRPPEMMQHFTLSEQFCRQHFLSGLILQELKSSLNEVGHVRRHALGIFKDLLAKHELDNRYQQKGQLSRIALLYVPWLGVVMDNIHRIDDLAESGACTPNGHVYADSASYTKRLSCSSSYVFSKDSSTFGSLTSTPRSKNRLTMHCDQASPYRTSVHMKEHNYLAAIAGQPISNGISNLSLNSNTDSGHSQDTTTIGAYTNGDTDVALRNGHNRSVSVTHAQILSRCDKFSSVESKDLLLGFLFIIKHLSQEQMVAWWQNCNESETLQFLSILDLCLLQFRYVGKKSVVISTETRQGRLAKANTLPARTQPPTGLENGSQEQQPSSGTLNQTREHLLEDMDTLARSQLALYESNLATEVGMIILDCLGLYVLQFRQLLADSLVLPKVARVYLRFLQLGQSERLSKHVFAALRAFINNYAMALFKGNAMLCGQMVYELLKACDSRLVEIRHESCAVLYLLMRSNFEFSGRKALTRVHLQVIISVSQMIGNVIGLNNARFQESLSIINSYANSDKAMKGTGFPMEVKDLTRRVRTVLMATAQMQAHHMDPERLLELQYSLANSYASTPELRHTWLVTMARNHEQNGNLSEAACCHLHIAALMCEYLRLRGGCTLSWSSTAFGKISTNIPLDEQGLKLDAGAQDSQYTEQMLLEQLKLCADFLDRAERFECLGELYKLILPMYERDRSYQELAHCYEHLTQAYNKIGEVNRSGKRMLGRFYRVVFYGMMYFEEDHAIEYVYKEPKLTSLSEISERLAKQYKEKFGADVVKMIMDSSPVKVDELDAKLAYIQVTHVIPFFSKDELDQRLNEFEQNHDVDTFMYETPFTKSGAARGSVEEQWKRKTVIKTQYSFPYVLKRIPVKSREIIELSPIEVAIDEMQSKVSELEEIILPPADVKKLQLRLQGSVAVTVNAGPLAYAHAFLDAKVVNNFSMDRVGDLKDVFRDFIVVCQKALFLNERIISADQKEYHHVLKENYEKLCQALSELLDDESFQPLGDDADSINQRNSMALFNAISGASHNSRPYFVDQSTSNSTHHHSSHINTQNSTHHS
ncbi:dedicator of cytokinesis protein 9 isoform X1 [Drosophila teissieri]|uniref:dedicator of cytokinesis protein 9 isoform X1 n=1 Tax=Drosophila teissieri TaxID=7243 RepID=UPI001CBA391B|nr:dedicator of cytokinesis protein 9 isoform X1 [Drosophila teissieri]XP_043640418.1 dedicator of cytokinesis protein 9 isoform X1 [Drosophila teissieri]